MVYYSISSTGISGKIIDKETSEDLSGVMIIVNEKDTTYTDLYGNFNFKNVKRIEKIDLKYPSYSDDNLVLIQGKDIFD